MKKLIMVSVFASMLLIGCGGSDNDTNKGANSGSNSGVENGSSGKDTNTGNSGTNTNTDNKGGSSSTDNSNSSGNSSTSSDNSASGSKKSITVSVPKDVYGYELKGYLNTKSKITTKVKVTFACDGKVSTEQVISISDGTKGTEKNEAEKLELVERFGKKLLNWEYNDNSGGDYIHLTDNTKIVAGETTFSGVNKDSSRIESIEKVKECK